MCGKTVKKSEFFTQTFEDVTVEKEVRVRKQMMRVYVRCGDDSASRAARAHTAPPRPLSARGGASRSFNKREDDFGTLHEYNDYLEMVEDTSTRALPSGTA